MPGNEVEAKEQPDTPITGLAEVTAAFHIIRQVRKANLRWQPEMFSTIMYDGTELARPVPRIGYVGENEVLMKNVYYLATKTRNMSNALVLKMVCLAMLTTEEGNSILQQPTSKLRAVKLYSILVEKEDPENSIATSIVEVLLAHENMEVAKIFAERLNSIECRVKKNSGDEVVTQDNVGEVMAEEEAVGAGYVELDNKGWVCRHCTFINNNPKTTICEMCSKTVGFTLEGSSKVNVCSQCTLINEDNTTFCEACGHVFIRENPDEEDEVVPSDSDDEW